MKLFGRIFQSLTDTLKGFKTTAVEIMDESFLSKGEEKFQQTLIASADNNDTVKGTVLELTTEELTLADKYEPDNYKRIRVTLESGKKAWVYIATKINISK